MKGLKFALPLLVAMSVAVGPALLPGSPQEALAAQTKPEPAVRPAEPHSPAEQAKPDPSVKPAKPHKPKRAKAAGHKPAKPAKHKPAKHKVAKHKPAKPAKRKDMKAAKPRKLVKHGKKPAKSAKKSGLSVTRTGKFLLCRQNGSVRVHSKDNTYLVNNNDFEGLAECLSGSAHAPAFRVAESHATATGPDSDAFPDIYTGCSWGRCSPGTKLPARVSSLGNPVTTWDTTEKAGGWWAASYDMWFDPRPIRTGQADAEMMIWLNAQGLYNPAGMGWPVVRIDGALWYVLTWITGNGHQQWRYVQFRKYTPRWNVTGLSLKPFYQYMEKQGWISPSWYALNVEAGFEIWNGGTGLATTAFSES
jgi:hypothetical protein